MMLTNRIFIPIVTPALLLALIFFATTTTKSTSMAQDEKHEGKLLRHVVMFQFKEESSEQDVQKVVDAFRDLKNKIPQISDFEYGVNNSPENMNDGLTHCFLVTFKSEEDREIYLPHPAHKEFVGVLGPHLKKATVIDYWAEK